ncbi:hypothetical protein E2C01_100631 [Portunus trituberculatus]|uniref:Uncharacterized protein n=1 Tax=Portunus trituberculatus TaxID=210409 RepID=A0A5B7KI28_PORTR|nr:hypothetical protein [Portunus trituberculatus]
MRSSLPRYRKGKKKILGDISLGWCSRQGKAGQGKGGSAAAWRGRPQDVVFVAVTQLEAVVAALLSIPRA